ncbi:MAG: DivIVA domain-containing protein [Firmicutes bacterium]|nr:DivIVA domain-containing protein [Bacillota bacterium]
MGLKTLQELNRDFQNKGETSSQYKMPDLADLAPDAPEISPEPLAGLVTDLTELLADLTSGLSETSEELTLMHPESLPDVFFATQQEGYNKAEVEHYVNKLREAYQTAYSENQTISDKYERLTRDYQELKTGKQLALNAEIIAKILLEADVLARKNVAEARAEADRIVGRARKKVGRAYEAIGQVVNEARELMVLKADSENTSGKQDCDSRQNSDDQALGGELNGFENVAGAESRIFKRAGGKFSAQST